MVLSRDMLLYEFQLLEKHQTKSTCRKHHMVSGVAG